MGDTTIAWVITVFFIGLGVTLPIIEAEFTGDSTSSDASQLSEQLATGLDDSDISSIDTAASIGNVFKSVILMFFWTFGQVPFLIDAIILLPMRFMLVFLLARIARGVGG